MNDTDRLKRLAQGDNRAFEEIYLSEKDAVYAYACSLVGPGAEAEDLCQEAFMGLIRRGPGLVVKGSLRGYLLRSVRNRNIDRARRGGREVSSDESSEPMDHDATEAHVEWNRSERHAAVHRALDDLPEEQADAVRQRIFGRLSYDAIATSKGVPSATIRSRYRTALAKLTSKLQGVIDHERSHRRNPAR